eukprot:753492-Hanusia_phi.AAC.2
MLPREPSVQIKTPFSSQPRNTFGTFFCTHSPAQLPKHVKYAVRSVASPCSITLTPASWRLTVGGSYRVPRTLAEPSYDLDLAEYLI